jgi:glycosyltransferase involved in cell wall biosynthesis
MKKVARIITRLNIGGPTIHTVLLSDKLKKKYQTTLIAGKIENHESDMSYYADKYNVKPLYLSKMSRELRFPDDFFAFWELYKILKKEKPDIVHTHTAKAGTLGRLAAWFAGVPEIYHTFHGNIFKGYFSPLKTKVFIAIEKFLAAISTRIIVISEKQRDEIAGLKIAPQNKLEIVKLGFDFENVLPQESDKGTFKKQFGYSEDDILIGIVGRVTAIKNHYLFLDIAEKLSKLFPNVKFPIIGDGDLREEIQEEIDKRKLNNTVKITGFLTNLKPVYADLNYVTLTSKNEGTPVALIEAMACKKVVLSTNVGGVSDFISNGKSGFYFDSFKPDDFVKVLSDLINGKIDKESIVENANITAQKMFGSNRLVNDILKIYADA